MCRRGEAARGQLSVFAAGEGMRLPPGKVRPGVHIAYMPKGRQPCTDEIQLLQIAASSTEAVVRNRGRNVRKGLVRIWVGGMLE